jgi:large subunit ribosomal protein L17
MRERAEQFFDIPDDGTVERNRYGELRKCPTIVKHIFENVAPRFEDRAGGYTRVVKLGKRRVGDAAEYCVLQFVGAEDGPEIGGNPSKRRRKADRRTAYFADVKKGWACGAASAKAEAVVEEPAAEAAVEEPQVDSPEASGEGGGEESKD